MRRHSGGQGHGGRQGLLVSSRQILLLGGPLAFMKGWSASYFRIGPQTTIIFILTEALRNLASLEEL